MIVALYPKNKLEFSFRDAISESFDECNPLLFWKYESQNYQLYNLLTNPELDNLQKAKLGITIFFDFAFGITNEKVLPNNVKKWMSRRYKTVKQLEEKLYELHFNSYQLYQHAVSDLLTEKVHQETDKKVIIELGAEVYRFNNQYANDLTVAFIINNGKHRYIDYRIYEYTSMLNSILVNSISGIGKALVGELKAMQQTSNFESSVDNLQRLVGSQRVLSKFVRHTTIYNDKYVQNEIKKLAEFIFQPRTKIAYERITSIISGFLYPKVPKEIIQELQVGLTIMLKANRILFNRANEADFAERVEAINRSFRIKVEDEYLFYVRNLKQVENLPDCIAILENKSELLEFISNPKKSRQPIFLLDGSAELRNYYVYSFFSNKLFKGNFKLTNVTYYGAFATRQNQTAPLKTSAVKKFVTKHGRTYIPAALQDLLTGTQS